MQLGNYFDAAAPREFGSTGEAPLPNSNGTKEWESHHHHFFSLIYIWDKELFITGYISYHLWFNKIEFFLKRSLVSTTV